MGKAAAVFAWLNDAPEPGAIDPLFIAAALVAIFAFGLASAIAWWALPSDGEPLVSIEDPYRNPFGDVVICPKNMRQMPRIVTEDYCPRCGVIESSCVCFMHAALPYHPRDPLRRSFTHHHFSRLDSAGLALRSDDADGGWPVVPSWLVAVSRFFRGGRDA